VNVRARVLSLALVLTVATLAGAAEDASVDMPAVVERYSTDAQTVSSFYRVPLSDVRDERLERFYAKWAKKLERLAGSPEGMGRDGKVDLILLRDHVAHAVAQNAWEAERDAEAAPLLPFAKDVVALEEARRRLDPLSPKDAASVLAAARVSIEDLRKRLAKKYDGDDALRPEKLAALRASRSVGAIRRSLKDWFTYRNGYEPEFGWWVRKPHGDLDKALDDYAKFLRETVAGVKGQGANAPIVGEPIGEAAIAEALRHERLAYSAEDLVAMAEKHLAWCDEEGRKASEELGHGGDWHKAVEAVKGSYVPPGEMDDLVTEQAREAIQFVTKDKGLIDVPPLCEEVWRLDMISEQGQKTLPFAAYGGNKMVVAYTLESMPHETKLMSLRGNNRHFSRIVVPHELIPGHHLQGFMAARHATHRGPFRTPFLVEGWALYWEMRLYEQGWAQGPEDRIGMLFWRKHRCARVIVSLGFHLGTMSTDEMIEFLVERVGLERDGATAEVRRYVGGAYGPLYQCAYLIGGLQMRALHREAVEQGGMSEKDFHAEVLRQNSIPIDLIRARVLKQKIDVTATPSWRFAD
jgi:hypothetical protein